MSQVLEISNGNKYYSKYGKYHRVDGPAIHIKDGIKVWYLNGLCHRINGPAVEHDDGRKEWFVNRNNISSIKNLFSLVINELCQ